MDYKVEVMEKKKIIFSHIYKGYSHPNQVVKNTIKSIGKNRNFMYIFVINTYGEMWAYVADKSKQSGFNVRPVENTMGGKNEYILAFSGNKMIAEMM